jgi:ubiquitin-conjugating enzyme E2 Q
MCFLHSDFIDTVATGFRPGLIRFGADEFCLSVSIPMVTLAESIPPQALMAWDRRLLSSTNGSQHLVLLISGLRGVYPPLTKAGHYEGSAQSLGANLSFKVGLSGRYKPSEVNAKEACRTFGLIVEDAEDVLRAQAEKAALEAAQWAEWDADNDGTDTPPVPVVNLDLEEEEGDEVGRFDRFALSGSLEGLMDQSFLKVVQLRRRFGFGWAGAEVLYNLCEKAQMKPEDVLQVQLQVGRIFFSLCMSHIHISDW